jgi:DNA-binding XRE family transcriptional regulator
MKKSEYYKDILTYIEARLGLIQALQDASETKDHYRRQLYLHIVEQRQQEIDRWLNEEASTNLVLTKNIDKEQIIKTAESDCKLGVKNFADRIHSLRKSAKITMADLYNMSGVSSSTINDVEKAKYIPSLDIILKLGYALGLPKDDIFGLLKGDKYE